MRRWNSWDESQAIYTWIDERLGPGWGKAFLWGPVIVMFGLILWEVDIMGHLRAGGSKDAQIRQHMRDTFLRTCADDSEITENCHALVDRHDALCRWSEDSQKYYECVRRSEEPGWEPPKDTK